MVNFFIYAKDFSGSTDGNSHFHSNGMKSYEQFKSHVEKIKQEQPSTESKIIYLHWGTRCYEVDENETVTSYKNLTCGHMGTMADTIIDWIKHNYDICGDNNKIKLLYIITDGMISDDSVEKCFELNENMHYETVVFHAFNTNEKAIDLSVAASFFKSRCLVYRNYELFDNIDISEDFDYDKITVDNFETEIDSLTSYIKLKFIKTSKHDARALQEINKLKNLRNRLFAELLSKPNKIKKVNLETKDKDAFLREFRQTQWYQNLYLSVQDTKVDIEKTISTLINYIVSDQRSFSFDVLKFHQTFVNNVVEEPIVDVDFAGEQEIQFPDIILDDDKGIPVIILTELNLLDKIIFNKTKESAEVSSASFNKFKSIMDCPLFLLNDQDVSESIGYFYTLNVYKKLLANTGKTEPRTRKPFHGGLVLVDSDEFDKYNDYILSATYFNSKKVNCNIGLFYFVLWKISENKEWMDRNVVDRFKKYIMRRISTTVCKIGLSSLPLDPKEKTSLLTALWYCVELSSCLFKNDPENFMLERLRMYYGVAHYMIEILQYFNYDLDLNTIEKRIDIIRNVSILKQISKYPEKVYYLLEKIFKNLNGFLICEIERPFCLNKLNYLKLDHKGMLSDDVIEKKVHLNNYVHLMHFANYKGDQDDFKLCEKTFRPFFTIEKNKSFYTELVKVTKKVVINNDDDENKIKISYDDIDCLEFDRILSLYNLFINCVKHLEKYPTFAEYVEYIYLKKKFHGNLVTIFPPNVYSAAETVYSSYQNIMTKVDVSKFIEVTKKYVSRSERIKAEGVVKFNNDVEINQFISSEESKVFLTKRT
ncbi:unnamed protein product [Euphydryas editha]|uniref:Uncharacterized protein n=1 Tax=Euphydryas editha TaxID=104508 RepID=A0AAU9T8N4_EUPED|nr:unnamed protein product [Euphydryas editha]